MNNEESPPKTRGGHFLWGRGDRATYVAYRRWHPEFFNKDGSLKPEYKEQVERAMANNKKEIQVDGQQWNF